MRVRTFLSVVCLLSGASAAYAQQTADVQAGAIGGLTFFQLSASDNTGTLDFNTRTGWSAGVFITTPPRSGVSLQQEVQFTVRRTEFAQSGVLLTQRYTSIDVPVLVRFSTAPRGSSSLHLLAGPALAFRTDVNQTTIAGGTSTTQDIDNEARRFDVAIAVGGGVDIGRWLFDVRYLHGLRNALTDRSNNASARLRTIAVLTGVRF